MEKRMHGNLYFLYFRNPSNRHHVASKQEPANCHRIDKKYLPGRHEAAVRPTAKLVNKI